eukprot:1180162-Prorocentrum_minimum.AAC.1
MRGGLCEWRRRYHHVCDRYCPRFDSYFHVKQQAHHTSSEAEKPSPNLLASEGNLEGCWGEDEAQGATTALVDVFINE